jgi:hypothetical protein
LLHAGFLLVIFFYPEDVGDIFPETVVGVQLTTRRYVPGDRNIHNNRCDNLWLYLLTSVELNKSIAHVVENGQV